MLYVIPQFSFEQRHHDNSVRDLLHVLICNRFIGIHVLSSSSSPRRPEGSSSMFRCFLSRFFQPTCVCSQTDEERQQALQAFAAQSFLGAAQHAASSSGSASSAHVFSSPLSSSEHKTKAKRVPRKTQNEKYRLKYLRLRRAARAFVFVSGLLIDEDPACCRRSLCLMSQRLCLHMSQENAALCDEVAHLEEKFLKAKEERR